MKAYISCGIIFSLGTNSGIRCEKKGDNIGRMYYTVIIVRKITAVYG